MIDQLFVQIHPHAGCSPMHAHFRRCYQDETPERILTMAAVA
jgi:hypothetical protein